MNKSLACAIGSPLSGICPECNMCTNVIYEFIFDNHHVKRHFHASNDDFPSWVMDGKEICDVEDADWKLTREQLVNKLLKRRKNECN